MNFKKLTPYLTGLFIIVVSYVLFRSLSSLDWKTIIQTVKEVPLNVFLPGLILSLLNYAILSHFDYMGVRFFNFPLSYLRTVFSAFFCYVFNLNLGSLVGGLAFRFRIYTGWGLSKEKVPFILVFSTLTNWTGYLLLLSLLMLFKPVNVAEILGFPVWSLRLIGLVGVALVVMYLYSCITGRETTIKGKKVKFPHWKFCFVQITSSCIQWGLMAFIVFYFLHYFKVQVTYPEVLFTYLIASVAGLIAHIPAGLGVIEAVFLKLQINAKSEDLVVALICFRIVYYLVPLLIALPGYLYLEFFQKTKVSKMLLFSIVFLCAQLQASPNSLNEISAQMNKSLPEVYDPVTKLISTSVENNNFKYHFVLKANHKEYSWALPKVKAKILESICSKPRERTLLKQYRANLVYSYENVEGQLLGQFMVKPEQCR